MTVLAPISAPSRPWVRSYTAAESRALEDHYIAGFARIGGSRRGGKAPVVRDFAGKGGRPVQSEKRRAVLDAIRSAGAARQSDILATTGFSVASVQSHVRKLLAAGQISREPQEYPHQGYLYSVAEGEE